MNTESVSLSRAESGVGPGASCRVVLDGVRIDALDERGVVSHVMAALGAGRGGWVITPNLDHLRRARRDAEFTGMLREADLVVADGMPLIWASRLQGTPLPERVAGSSLVWTLAEAAAAAGRSLYLLGGAPGAAEGAARVLQERYRSLRIVGQYCPPMGFEHNADEMQTIRESIVTAKPDIIYVALGSPKQERVIRELRACRANAWWLGVGISLSFICGQVHRAPRWMQWIGLEWVHRLAQEPRRLARRYLVEGLPYAAALMGRAAKRRVSGGARPRRSEDRVKERSGIAG